MVIELIRYELPDSAVGAFLEAYGLALSHLAADPHCLAVEVLHGVEAPARVVIRIEWDSMEGHERHFTRGAHFEPFITPLRPFLRHIVEMAHYRRVLTGDPG
jgi:quinol monooxygenase YgiN